ncbi:hypothetical protein N7535_003441 [Penicillium sp. DV-2018c]|nr:hypothetical protein N7461_000862 [Penicillium sp. DV-2018c]KAJ5576515.1 hypothetical protein N7535_003441 [Penicillium sp. DV-2018c]
MNRTLEINGYSDLLSRNKSEPSESKKKDRWFTRQEKACGAVNGRLDDTIETAVNLKKTLIDLLSAIEAWVCPNSGAQLDDLDSSKHDRIIGYIKEFRDIRSHQATPSRYSRGI